MALEKIVLVANPGSASRKYALFKGSNKLCEIHFEIVDKDIVYKTSSMSHPRQAGISHLTFAATALPKILVEETDPSVLEVLHAIAVRVVAPSTFFQRDHILTTAVIKRLERVEPVAPLHIGATLAEYRLLAKTFPKCRFVGISDSKFLSDKPQKAMLYGIPYRDANKLDVKRFGYHGLSLESVTCQLKSAKLLPKRAVVCHLGGGSSVAAIENGKVIDSTMGFSPLEGLIMATRSGSVDVLAYETLKKALRLSPDHVHEYFNNQSGLLGISGLSDDIRQLQASEHTNQRAALALDMFVYKVRQAIGAMSASMNGVETLVFTGTVGERSSEMRKRIGSQTAFLGLSLDMRKNRNLSDLSKPEVISKPHHSSKVIVVHANETAEIARQANKLLNV